MSADFLSLCCHPLTFAQKGLWGALVRGHFESILWYPSTLHPTRLSEIIHLAEARVHPCPRPHGREESPGKSLGKSERTSGAGLTWQRAEGKPISEGGSVEADLNQFHRRSVRSRCHHFQAKLLTREAHIRRDRPAAKQVGRRPWCAPAVRRTQTRPSRSRSVTSSVTVDQLQR